MTHAWELVSCVPDHSRHALQAAAQRTPWPHPRLANDDVCKLNWRVGKRWREMLWRGQDTLDCISRTVHAWLLQPNTPWGKTYRIVSTSIWPFHCGPNPDIYLTFFHYAPLNQYSAWALLNLGSIFFEPRTVLADMLTKWSSITLHDPSRSNCSNVNIFSSVWTSAFFRYKYQSWHSSLSQGSYLEPCAGRNFVSAPAKFKPAPNPQEFEKFCPLPPLPQTIPTRSRPALFRSQTRTCPKSTKNS